MHERGLLEPSLQLPGKDPPPPSGVYEAAVLGLQFGLDRRCKALREHINLGELRAQALVEEAAAKERPGEDLLVGTDSMVGLASVAKGRAQSPSLNRLLRRMLPNVLGGDLCSRGFWICSALNPLGDPTRNKEIRPPSF